MTGLAVKRAGSIQKSIFIFIRIIKINIYSRGNFPNRRTLYSKPFGPMARNIGDV
jgi:hypothetical protein